MVPPPLSPAWHTHIYKHIVWLCLYYIVYTHVIWPLTPFLHYINALFYFIFFEWTVEIPILVQILIKDFLSLFFLVSSYQHCHYGMFLSSQGVYTNTRHSIEDSRHSKCHDHLSSLLYSFSLTKPLGYTHVNGWYHIGVPRGGDSTNYIFPLDQGFNMELLLILLNWRKKIYIIKSTWFLLNLTNLTNMQGKYWTNTIKFDTELKPIKT